MTVGLVTTRKGFADAAAEWTDLLERADGDRAFRSHGWLDAWLRNLAPRAGVRLLWVRDGRGMLAGLVPFAEEVRGLGVRCWSLMGSGSAGSDYLDAIAATEVADTAVAALARGTIELAGSWDVLRLRGVPETSAFLAGVRREAEAAGLPLLSGPREVCPVIDLQGGYEEALRAGDPAFVRQAVRKRRRLEREEGFCFGVWTGVDRVPEAVSLYLDLHRRRFGERSEAVGFPSRERFHRQAMEAFARQGSLRFYWLALRGKVAAVIWGFERDRRYYYYQTGFDPAFGNLSVGIVLLLLALEDCAARGVKEFDLLHGNEGYKFGLASRMRWLDGLRVYHRSVRGYWALALDDGRKAGGRALRRLLPAALVARLRSAGGRHHAGDSGGEEGE